jgi:hypothetical protein
MLAPRYRAVHLDERWQARILHTCFSTIENERSRAGGTIRCTAHGLSAWVERSAFALSRSVQYFSTLNVLRHKAYPQSSMHTVLCMCEDSQVVRYVNSVHAFYRSFMPDALYIQRADMTLRYILTFGLPSQPHYMPQIRLLKRAAHEICR